MIWDALTTKTKAKHVSKNRVVTSINGRVRAYLADHPHSTATQVHRVLGLTQRQANCALNDLAKRGHAVAALDASEIHNRQINHYSLL